MKSAAKARLALLALIPLGIAVPAAARAPMPAAVAPSGPEADYPVTIGDPYVIGGTTYTPSDTLNYDAVGYARAGTQGSGISGAHHTLPLPCYVEVTALDTGHTILLRLDRRGPTGGKQLIELSPGAWAQLGFSGSGDMAVRVRRVNPPEAERARLRTGGHASDRMDTPPGLLTALRRKLVVATPSAPDEPPSALLAGPGKPVAPGLPLAPMPMAHAAPQPMPPATARPAPPAAAPPRPVAPAPVAAKPAPKPPEPKIAAKPAPKVEPKPAPKPEPRPEPRPEPKSAETKHAEPAHLTIQVAAFSAREHAEKAAAQVGGKVEAAGNLWRVRIPASSEEQAKAALAKAKQAGYTGAIILHHD